MHIKIIDEFDVQPLLDFYKSIESEIQWQVYDNSKQTGLQYRKGEDPWSDAVGVWKQSTTEWKDENFINPFFKGTIFEEIIKKYQIKRTRLMWAKPFACYSMHQDVSPRLHIPIITNPDCYFVFKDLAPIHMPAGKVYWTDTTKAHTAMNCSKEWRLHLVGSFL